MRTISLFSFHPTTSLKCLFSIITLYIDNVIVSVSNEMLDVPLERGKSTRRAAHECCHSKLCYIQLSTVYSCFVATHA